MQLLPVITYGGLYMNLAGWNLNSLSVSAMKDCSTRSVQFGLFQLISLITSWLMKCKNNHAVVHDGYVYVALIVYFLFLLQRPVSFFIEKNNRSDLKYSAGNLRYKFDHYKYMWRNSNNSHKSYPRSLVNAPSACKCENWTDAHQA